MIVFDPGRMQMGANLGNCQGILIPGGFGDRGVEVSYLEHDLANQLFRDAVFLDYKTRPIVSSNVCDPTPR